MGREVQQTRREKKKAKREGEKLEGVELPKGRGHANRGEKRKAVLKKTRSWAKKRDGKRGKRQNGREKTQT